MPLIGVFLKADFENVESIAFSDETAWSFEVEKAVDFSSGAMASGEITVSKESHGVVEWTDVKGPDRRSSDRSQRIGVMKAVGRRVLRQAVKEARGAQFDEYTSGSVGGAVLVAAFECQGCRPSRLVSCGPLTVKAASGQRIAADSLAFEYGWAAFVAGGAGGVACVSDIEVELRPLRP